jgi:hypothetical protein
MFLLHCSRNPTADGSICCDSYVSVILEMVLHPLVCNIHFNAILTIVPSVQDEERNFTIMHYA